MIKTVTPTELRNAFDSIEWNDYTLIETLPDGSEILVGDIFAAISAAVSAETERCAKVAQERANEFNKVSVTQSGIVASGIAAAIRARKEQQGDENMAKKITWTDLHNDTDSVAAQVAPLCNTNTNGIEDWLSAASTDTNKTARELANEWDHLNS